MSSNLTLSAKDRHFHARSGLFAARSLPSSALEKAVEPQVTTNDLRLMLRTALAGGGITFAPEETFQPFMQSGERVPLLGDLLPPFPGLFLYCPQRRNMAPKLRAQIEAGTAVNVAKRELEHAVREVRAMSARAAMTLWPASPTSRSRPSSAPD